MSYADKVRANGGLRTIHDTPARGMIAPTEMTSTASAAHAVGDYFIYNDLLYETMAEIAVGDTIAEGTNCRAAILGEEIDTINSAILSYSQPKTSADYTWTLKKNYDSTGTLINANGFALSNAFAVFPGTCIINQWAPTGYNGNGQALWIHEFNQSGVWLRRTSVLSGTIFVLGSDCYSVCFGFGYGSISGVTITQEMVDEYFKIAIAERPLPATDAAIIASDVDTLETVVNDSHGYVDYGYPHNHLDSTAAQIGVNRDGPVIVLNGGGLSNQSYIKIDSRISRATGSNPSSAIDAWTPTVTLESGHKYQFMVKWLSGDITNATVSPTLSLYLAGTHNTIGEYERVSNKEYVRTITGTGELVSIAIVCPASVVYTNTKLLVLMEDVTQSGWISEQRDFVDKLKSTILKKNPIDFSVYTRYGYYINSNGIWKKDDNVKCIFVRVPQNCYSVRIVPNGYVIYAFVTNSSHANNTPADFATGTTRMRVDNGTVADVVVPDGTMFIYIYAYSNTDGNVLPREMEYYTFGATADSNTDVANVRAMVENQLAYKQDSEHNDIPDNRGMRNAMRKAKQLSNIQWTPLADIPANDGYVFANGTTYTGMPYSSVKECMKFVGKDVSFRTFMTAVHNPYSLLYTENVSAENSQSGYGFEYHGENCASYYGDVCSSLDGYV